METLNELTHLRLGFDTEQAGRRTLCGSLLRLGYPLSPLGFPLVQQQLSCTGHDWYPTSSPSHVVNLQLLRCLLIIRTAEQSTSNCSSLASLVRWQDTVNSVLSSSRYPDFQQLWGPPSLSIRDIEWQGQLPVPDTCETFHVLFLLAAARTFQNYDTTSFFYVQHYVWPP